MVGKRSRIKKDSVSISERKRPLMKKKILNRLYAVLIFCLTLVCVRQAHAADWIIEDDSAEKRPWDVGVLLGIPLSYGSSGVALTGVLDIPVVDQGILPINDSLDVEVGLNTLLFVDPFVVGATPFAGARWNFHFQQRWDAYAALRLGVYINDGVSSYVNGSVGTTYQFNDTWGIRGEVGGGYGGAGISAGVNIAF